MPGKKDTGLRVSRLEIRLRKQECTTGILHQKSESGWDETTNRAFEILFYEIPEKCEWTEDDIYMCVCVFG